MTLYHVTDDFMSEKDMIKYYIRIVLSGMEKDNFDIAKKVQLSYALLNSTESGINVAVPV